MVFINTVSCKSAIPVCRNACAASDRRAKLDVGRRPAALAQQRLGQDAEDETDCGPEDCLEADGGDAEAPEHDGRELIGNLIDRRQQKLGDDNQKDEDSAAAEA